MNLPNIFTGLINCNYLSTVDFPLTGVVASTPIDGQLLQDGDFVVLSDQTTASEIGIYSCAVTGANYTLSEEVNLDTGTTFNNGSFTFAVNGGNTNSGLWLYQDTGAASFNKINTGNAAAGITYTNYNAATDTPSLASLASGDAYIVTNAGRVTGIQVVGATISSDSFLCVGDIIDKVGATYKLRDAVINTVPGTVQIGTLNNASSIYFINFGEAIAYFKQRRLLQSSNLVVTVDSSYDGISYANPDSGTLNFSHPDYNLIEYRGNFTEVNATANTSNSGTIGNQTCNYTTAANTFTVNKYVQLYDETTSSLIGTNFLGAHSGTFLLTAATSTTISVNNTNLMRVVITALGDATFSTTKVRQCTNITARLIGTGLPKMQNLIFVDNTDTPILNVSGDWCIDGVVGFGCVGTSTRSTYIANLDAVNIYSGTFPTTGATPQPTSSILSISCKTGNITAQIAACNANMALGQIVMSPSALNLFNNSQVIANKIYGGITLDNNSVVSAVSQLAANNSASTAAILVNGGVLKSGDWVANSNAGGLVVNGGSVVISGSQYASRNLTSGNTLNGGSIYVNTQANISTNTASGNLIIAGDFVVGTQNVVSANAYGNRLITGTFTVRVEQLNVINNPFADNFVGGAGSMSILADNSGVSTAVTHNLITSDAGGIQLLSGSNPSSGSVAYTGYGYFMKTNGSNPTKVINPIIATASAGGAVPSYTNNVSLTAADNSGAGVSITTNYLKSWKVGGSAFLNASITYGSNVSGATASLSVASIPGPALNAAFALAGLSAAITLGLAAVQVVITGSTISFVNLSDGTAITNSQLSGLTITFTLPYNV